MNMNFDYPSKTRSDFLNEVVTLLITKRQLLGITQEELDYRLGVADRLISKWECGTRTPTAFHLYCWADALDCHLTIVANDNSPIDPDDLKPKAANDNNVFNVHKND